MAPARRNLFLTFAVFALEPMPFGAWLALIPEVKTALGLSKADLALALLGMPMGVFLMLQWSGRLVSRIGPRRLLAIALPVQALLVFLPLLAGSLVQLWAGLFLLGMCIAVLQVGLNVYAGRLEKARGAAIMNRCHGFWALGVTIGSFFVAVMAGVSAFWIVALIGLPSAALGIWVALSLDRLAEDDTGPIPPRRNWRAIPPRLGLIAICALAASMTEGAMADWAAVYLAERLPSDADHAGVAVTIFAAFLAGGRFVGDAARERLGIVRLTRAALVCALAGLACLILPLPLFTSYFGFALIGLGVSVGFPLGVSAAAELDDQYEGQNIAILSMVTMGGFLVGPPLIGGLAELFGLRIGLAALIPMTLAGLILARNMAPPSRVAG
ncbi:MFS transporter [Gymnodinialimonas sp. 2305UL16-5]|uniref:MFS transporter n=1 Tax=Gymnodinialimonas mytili TaxID=3126503 RepID=UPI0030AE3EF6